MSGVVRKSINVLRKLRQYLAVDVKEIIAPASIPNPPHYASVPTSRLTLKRYRMVGVASLLLTVLDVHPRLSNVALLSGVSRSCSEVIAANSDYSVCQISSVTLCIQVPLRYKLLYTQSYLLSQSLVVVHLFSD